MHYDILIVGGGPAGSLLAYLLGKQGRRVALIEAQKKISHRVCGSYLCPAGVELLKELGLAEKLLSGFQNIEGMCLVSPNNKEVQIPFPQDVEAAEKRGASLERVIFDNRLLDLLESIPLVSVFQGNAAHDFRLENDNWKVRLTDGELLESCLLVGADGRRSSVARHLGLTSSSKRNRVAFHAELPSQKKNKRFGEMHLFDKGTYIGLNPVDHTKVNISLVCDASLIKESSPEKLLRNYLYASPVLRARFGESLDLGKQKLRASSPVQLQVKKNIF